MARINGKIAYGLNSPIPPRHSGARRNDKTMLVHPLRRWEDLLQPPVALAATDMRIGHGLVGLPAKGRHLYAAAQPEQPRDGFPAQGHIGAGVIRENRGDGAIFAQRRRPPALRSQQTAFHQGPPAVKILMVIGTFFAVGCAHNLGAGEVVSGAGVHPDRVADGNKKRDHHL